MCNNKLNSSILKEKPCYKENNSTTNINEIHPKELIDKLIKNLQKINKCCQKDIKKCCQHDKDIKKIKKIIIVIIIFMIIELWGHFKTNSLSLLADALHLIVDISGFAVSLITLNLSKRKPNLKYNFGYQRYEILGGLISVILIWIAVGYLVAESIHKFIHPKEIDGKVFVGISIVGLLVNLYCVYILHSDDFINNSENIIDHADNIDIDDENIINDTNFNKNINKNKNIKQNLNLRATYIHVIGDVIQSIGVIIASIIIYLYPSKVVVDIFSMSLFFAMLVLGSTFLIVRDACIILTEGSPKNYNQNEIKLDILEFDKVLKITDLKIWSIGVNLIAVTIKVKVDFILIKEYENLLIKINNYFKNINIDIVTIQIDTPSTTNEEIFCQTGVTA